MKNQYGRGLYSVFGFVFLIFSIIFSIASITTGVFPVGQELVTFGISVMSFCLAYLYPQFKENDERSKLIREKGMFGVCQKLSISPYSYGTWNISQMRLYQGLYNMHWPKSAVSYTHLRAHETRHDLVCRLLLEKKKNKKKH